jgi:putative flippase GtrA
VFEPFPHVSKESMSDLSPRPNRTPSRRTREERAYRLVLAGGAAAVVAVVTFVLAVVGVLGFGVPVLAAIVAVVCAVLFRRTVS